MDQRAEVEDQSPAYRWVVLLSWQACAATGWMVVGSLGILLPAISADLSLSPGQQGLLASMAVWGNLGLALPLSWWVSRYRPKMLSSVAQLVAIISILLQGWGQAFALLLAGRLALGITLIAREPARALLIQQWFPQREVPLLNSIHSAIFTVVNGGGLLATAFILRALGDDWRGTFYTYAALMAALLIIWMALGRERVTTEYGMREVSRPGGLLRGALGYRDLWLGGFGFLSTTICQGAFASFFPTMMLETYAISLGWSGGLMAMSIGVGGLTGLGVVYLTTKLGKGKQIIQALGVLMAGSYLGMTLTGSMPVLVLLALLNGVAWGFWPLLLSVPFRLPNIRPREVAVALPFTMMMISSGMAVGPLAAGFIQEAGGTVRYSLWILSFSSLGLSVAGTYVRPGVVGSRAEARSARPSE